jgi:hypothetical protein
MYTMDDKKTIRRENCLQQILSARFPKKAVGTNIITDAAKAWQKKQKSRGRSRSNYY